MLKLSTLFGCSLDFLLKEEKKLATKTFRTVTYGAGVKDGKMRLKIDSGKKGIIPKTTKVKANVNLDTGEVTFFIEQEDLKELQS